MPRDGSGTRQRIVQTAMSRFIEHGYEKTSLREIAEDLGVTKAALYYHFRTKEDIVAAAVAGFRDAVTELQAWAAARPRTPESDAELVDRLITLVASDDALAIRFRQANPTVIISSSGSEEPEAIVPDLVRAVAGDAAGTEASLRALLAVGAVMMTAVEAEKLPIPGDAAARTAAARAVALDLLSR